MSEVQKENWTLVIKPSAGFIQLKLGAVWEFRDLVLLFVRRDLVALYKQTILGPLWFLLQPLINTIVFTIIFGNFAGIPTDGIPPFIFYMSGNVAWSYFANNLTGASNTFIENAGIFGKVYFPRLVVPVSIVISNLVKFGAQMLLFAGFYIYFLQSTDTMRVTEYILLVPLIMVQMALLSLGVGVLVSSLTTRYRDLRVLLQFGTSLWMYATPIIYPYSSVPERFQFVYSLNPMVGIIETFRFAFVGGDQPELQVIGISLAMTLVLFLFGVMMFNRVERTFMDTV